MSQKILVVDDELFMVRLIQHTLQKAGYELIPARNSREANAAMEQQKPDLIVGDPNVVNGGVKSAASETQKKNQTAPIPMICVSDTPTPASAENHGASQNIIFTKPFSPTKLLAEVKRLISSPSEGGAAS